MQNQQQTTFIQGDWTPIFQHRFDPHAAVQELASMPAAWTTQVPAAAATVLALDLLLQEPSLNLQAASDIILGDLGATLQVLRLAACGDSLDNAAPLRMEECLASLDSAAWFDAIAAQTVSRHRNQAQLTAVWQHSRLVAQYAAVIAESLDGVSTEIAYMVGLLHEVETVSLLLRMDEACNDDADLLLEHVIPSPVLDALAHAKERGSKSVWRYVLSSAHGLAAAYPQFVPAATRCNN